MTGDQCPVHIVAGDHAREGGRWRAMAGRDVVISEDEVMAIVRVLRGLLHQVEAGELECGPDQGAWLRGAVDALQSVVSNGVSFPS